MKDINTRIKKLREELLRLEKSYYSGNPEVEDDVYDFKLRTLSILESEYPEFMDENSPTKKVGFYREDEETVGHEIPMLSISNAFNMEDMNSFFSHCEKDTGQLEYILEPKIDGASISLIYKNGRLEKALSRGDGESGDDLTKRLLNIPSIPIHLNKIPKDITIRGEIYITKDDFESVKSSGEKEFSNHRNFVAGCLRLKKTKELRNKKLSLITYQILHPEKYGIKSQGEVIKCLNEWGFETHKNHLISSDKSKIYDYIEWFKDEKNKSNIPCDGLVIKVNDLSLLEEIGYTSKFPKWAIAYKYPSLVKETKLLDIIPSVGRTGKITYTALVDEVEINGSLIRHATLHNANHIMELDLRIGDYVGIYKSGEIVPKIIGFIGEKRNPNLSRWCPIEKCPSCGSNLVMYENLLTQFCENEDCTEKKYSKLTHWSSREAADIEGLSRNIIIKLCNLGIINGIEDLYRLHERKELILNSDLKIKDKLFNNLINSIEKSKNKDFKSLLFGLGITFVGEEVSGLISKKYSNIEDLIDSKVEDLLLIEGIGEKSARSLHNWFSVPKNIALVRELKSLGLFKENMVKKEIKDTFLKGKRIALTGKFFVPRPEFMKMLEENLGVIVKKDVSSQLDYLIAGLDGGSKIEKARSLGINILGEEEVMKLL